MGGHWAKTPWLEVDPPLAFRVVEPLEGLPLGQVKEQSGANHGAWAVDDGRGYRPVSGQQRSEGKGLMEMDGLGSAQLNKRASASLWASGGPSAPPPTTIITTLLRLPFLL